MNGIQNERRIIALASVFTSLFAFLGASAAYGAYPEIHAAWDGGGTPLPNFDYIVSTDPPASPDFPDVELVTGNLTWRIWSTDTDNPYDIGDIGVISCPQAADFGVQIRTDQPHPQGARDVKGIQLVPSDASNYASITDARIRGDLTGNLVVQRSSGGEGGRIDHMCIMDDMTGDLEAYEIVFLVIYGDVSGDIEVAVISETLSIGGYGTPPGELSGDVTVLDAIDHGWLTVERSTSTARIYVNDMRGSPDPDFAGIWSGSGLPGVPFPGDLFLNNGIPENCVVYFYGDLASTGTIDFNHQDLVGALWFTDGGSGQIINGGEITGVFPFGFCPAQGLGYSFTGEATFSALSGCVVTLFDADLGGTFTIKGDMSDGGYIDIDGDLLSGGEIAVGGDVIDSQGQDEILIRGDAYGDIDIDGALDGSIQINGTLKSMGRIRIYGLCDGPVTIEEETVALSQIYMGDGLGENGSITINDSIGDYDADGTIYIGRRNSDPLFDVTYDGWINIRGPAQGSGGDLTGTITVAGCHADEEDLDICICGDEEEGALSIVQFGCENQVDWARSRVCCPW